MTKKIVLILAFLAIATLSIAEGFALSDMEIRLHVLEEDGSPIEGAFVEVGFDKSGVIGGDSKRLQKLTDRNGRVHVNEKTLFGAVLNVEKNGYYTSSITLEPARNTDLTFYLREIIDPIGLYAQRFIGELPASQGAFGFDLKAGDWVAPYGNGLISHMVFESDFHSESILKFTGSLKLSFPQENDGYVELDRYLSPESQLKVEHNAPEFGYSNDEITWSRFRDIRKSQDAVESSTGNANPAGYFLRIGTSTNDTGDIVNSNYAKVYGKFDFFPFSRSLLFTYYYNSENNSRNLELDLLKNKYNNLSNRSKIRFP